MNKDTRVAEFGRERHVLLYNYGLPVRGPELKGVELCTNS